MSKFNLAEKSQVERNKLDVDLAASGIACRERLNLPVIVSEVEQSQPAELREYFKERLAFYRLKSNFFSSGSSPAYMKDKK